MTYDVARPILPQPQSLPSAFDSADTVALVGSRLCHDLISPLGAIGNGVELLAMSGVAMSPELQLIAQSVASANAKLKFFRVAFGQAAADQRLGRPEISAVLDDLAQGGRLSFDWQAEGDQSRRVVKLCFLGILCLETALPWGGRVTISTDGNGWRLNAEARKTKLDPALWQILGGAEGAVSPAQVQFALLPREAARQGRQVAWEIGETVAQMSF